MFCVELRNSFQALRTEPVEIQAKDTRSHPGHLQPFPMLGTSRVVFFPNS